MPVSFGSKHQYRPSGVGNSEWRPLSDGWHRLDHKFDIRTWNEDGAGQNDGGGPRLRLVLKSLTHPGEIGRISWGSGEGMQVTADGKGFEDGSRAPSSRGGGAAYVQMFEEKVRAKYGDDLSEIEDLRGLDAYEVQVVMVPNPHPQARGPKPQLVDVRKIEDITSNPSSPSAKKDETGAAEGSPYSPKTHEKEGILSKGQWESRAGLEAYLAKHKSLEITPQTPALLMPFMKGGNAVEQMMMASIALRPEVLKTFDYDEVRRVVRL